MAKKTTREKIDKIVLDLEEQAESENYHDMGGIYGPLSEIVIKHAGEEAALKIMKDVKASGGWIGC